MNTEQIMILDKEINTMHRKMDIAKESNREGSQLSWKYYQGAFEMMTLLRTKLLFNA